MKTIKLRLMLFCFATLFFGGSGLFFTGFSSGCPAAWAAGPAVPALPAVDVSEETLPGSANSFDSQGRPIVVELYSSQACVFCPQADRLFADILKQPGIIGLACHVDYFDVKKGSLAQSFCTRRQSWYMNLLRAGPNYTPQMVIDGRYDVIGYKTGEVSEAIKRVAASAPLALGIASAKDPGGYTLSWPEGVKKDAENLHLFLAVLDKPRDVTVAEGRNKGQKITYNNIVSGLQDLGAWAGGEKTFTLPLTAGQSGFAVLLQDVTTGQIVAAGQYAAGAGAAPESK